MHFECKYRSLTVVSSLSARTLGGNRTVAEVGAALRVAEVGRGAPVRSGAVCVAWRVAEADVLREWRQTV